MKTCHPSQDPTETGKKAKDFYGDIRGLESDLQRHLKLPGGSSSVRLRVSTGDNLKLRLSDQLAQACGVFSRIEEVWMIQDVIFLLGSALIGKRDDRRSPYPA